MFRSATDALSHILTDDPIAPLTNAVLLKHRQAVLTCELPVLEPSLSRATGSLIATNIRDLVNEQRSARLDAETLRRRKEEKRTDTMLGTAYRDLLNLS